MERKQAQAGVSGMSIYLPRFRVRLEDWCGWTENSWDKVQTVVGRSFRVCAEHENVYTMAANAVLRLIVQNSIDPGTIGFLGLGTESSTDNSAGAVIIRGMVDRALEYRGLSRLSRNMEVPEFKHACLGGIYALKSALRFVATDSSKRNAIVVCADVVKYERGSTGEQTQGAGAVAMFIEEEPKLFEVDLLRTGSASDYRGPDFRKPFSRYLNEGYVCANSRINDFPVFSGKYSTMAYIDETAHAVEHMLSHLGVSAGRYYRSVRGLFFHRPYHHMPILAMSFLYVRGMARGKRHHDELRNLCKEADVSYLDVISESRSNPDLYEQVLHAGGEMYDPYIATSTVAATLRRHQSFRELLEDKMSLGSKTVTHLGNLYTGALPSWLAAGFEEAAQNKLEITGAPMVAIGYGSGDAAEAIPFYPVEGWPEAAQRIGLAKALADPIDLTCSQYEALHDGQPVTGIKYSPRQEFVISHIGQQYEKGFQDLGIEYYEYIE